MLESIKKIAEKILNKDEMDGLSLGISISDGCIGEKITSTLKRLFKREEPC